MQESKARQGSRSTARGVQMRLRGAGPRLGREGLLSHRILIPRGSENQGGFLSFVTQEKYFIP